MKNQKDTKKVGIIGGGWYGCHIALSLSKQGYTIILFEKNPTIFSEISGKFGVRLHVGPHYPRSPATRKSCREGFKEFCEKYPQLLNHHEFSIYGLGKLDEDNQPPKVTQEQFREVCSEFNCSSEVVCDEKSRFRNLFFAFNMNEPSIIVGEKLRKTFEKLLTESYVKILYNSEIKEIIKLNDKISIKNNHEELHEFDHVINATSYQTFLPKEPPPFKIEVVYQPCLALVYEDTIKPLPEKRFSFIVMDGSFPCVMPYDDGIENDCRKYILTHGKWTILGSYKTVKEGYTHLSRINDDFIQDYVKPPCESSIDKFWPEFQKRFRYLYWIGAILAKIKTDKEFRSAITFQNELSGLIYFIPGKVSNIFDVEREALALITKQKIVNKGNYLYVKGGVLDDSIHEIEEKPKSLRNTCELQPYLTHFKKNENIVTSEKRISILLKHFAVCQKSDNKDISSKKNEFNNSNYQNYWIKSRL